MTTRVCLTHLGGGDGENLGMAPWVKRDADILAERCTPRPLMYGSRWDVPALALALMTSDVSLNWFAWDNALWSIRLGKWLRVPGIVIVGGFDVARLPEINYGAMRTPRGEAKVRTILSNAAHVFALSEFLRGSVHSVAPDVPIEALHLGFDPAEYPPGPELSERRGVCTIGDVTESNLLRKGIADVVEVARYLDDTPVHVIGRLSPSLSTLVSAAPDNVTFLDYVPKGTLIDILHGSKVYLQLSRHEGFGSAVAEAMLCRCVPVVSRAGALPEVVGDAGYYANLGNPEEIAEVVRHALDDPARGNAARRRVIDRFPLAKRRTLLLRRVQEVASRR